jgi:hypothetical protein
VAQRIRESRSAKEMRFVWEPSREVPRSREIMWTRGRVKGGTAHLGDS